MKIKVFELEFDASNLHEVAFVKEVITGSSLNVPATGLVTAPAQEEKPLEVKETASSPVTQEAARPKRKKTECSAPAPAGTVKETAPVETAPVETAPVETAPVETTPAPANAEPTAKEMQDLVISLIKTGTLGREDVQTIFNEFGGTSLMKIAPAKFALLKQRLTTYNN